MMKKINMEKNWKNIRLILPLLLIIWIIFTAFWGYSESNLMIQAPQKGFLAPDISLMSMDGKQVSLDDFEGQIVILNLWASWCPPCVKEMAAIQQVYSDYQAEGLTVLAINMTFQDNQIDASNFVKENQLSFPILFDLTGDTAKTYNMYALPTTFFVTRQGFVQDVTIGGPMSEAFLRAKIETLLESE